jgi:hypothetical protein
MPVDKVTCPNCQAVLRPAKPVDAGKKVKCPRCGTGFVVSDVPMDVTAAEPLEPPSPPVPERRPYDEDEDTGPATYEFKDQPEPVRKKPARDYDDDDYEDEEEQEFDEHGKMNLSIVADLTVKDPRGIAQEKVIRPSNWLMFSAIASIILELIRLSWFLIPVFFSLPEDTSLTNPPGFQQSKETAKEKDFTKDLTWGLAKWLFVLLQILASVIVFVYNGFIVIGTVKIQNLEGYAWGITACILGLLPGCTCCYPLSLISGIVCLITMRNPQVIEGFEYKARKDNLF